ncbi:MAG: hypothetical protein WAR76_25400, partial [Xanthobacteraceae bacterium]
MRDATKQGNRLFVGCGMFQLIDSLPQNYFYEYEALTTLRSCYWGTQFLIPDATSLSICHAADQNRV